jgi:hypothetical protein
LQIEVGPTLLPQICSLLQFYTAAKRNDTIEEFLRYFTNSVVSESLPSHLSSGVQDASKNKLISMMVLDSMKEVHSHSTFVSIHQQSKMPQENSLVSLMMLDFMEQVDGRKYSRPRL